MKKILENLHKNTSTFNRNCLLLEDDVLSLNILNQVMLPCVKKMK